MYSIHTDIARSTLQREKREKYFGLKLCVEDFHFLSCDISEMKYRHIFPTSWIDIKLCSVKYYTLYVCMCKLLWSIKFSMYFRSRRLANVLWRFRCNGTKLFRLCNKRLPRHRANFGDTKRAFSVGWKMQRNRENPPDTLSLVSDRFCVYI